MTAERLRPFGTTVFTEMTLLAQRHGAVNLGQGFPDFDGPEWVRDAAIEAIRGGRNQYARMYGLPELNAAISAHQQRFYDLVYDPETEVTVTSGATEAIFAAIQGLFDPGDEVILFEPYYDSYRAGLAMAGLRERIVTLHKPSFRLDPSELQQAVGPRTRALLLNSPHNPTGKLFADAELSLIAELCVRHDLIAITDEVYEHLVYEGKHRPLATFPGMRERTVTISSAGKTFSLTGWKIGWALAPPPLTKALRTAHQFITFCSGTPFQVAIARGLAADDRFFAELQSGFRRRRDRLCDGLRRLGMEVLQPSAAYFAVVELGEASAEAFCRRLPAELGVAAIPCSAFYAASSAGQSLVRFAFCKRDETIDAGLERLAGWRR